MEEKLKFIFNNVNDLLKFAEAKNGVIIAFNGAVIFQLFEIIKDINSSNIYFICLIVLIGFWILSFIIALISFFPIINNTLFSRKNKRKANKDNLIFYGDIAKYKEEEYLQALSSSFKAEDYSCTNFEKNCANQIIINSRIALNKFKCFQISLVLNLLGATIPLLILLIYFVIGFLF